MTGGPSTIGSPMSERVIRIQEGKPGETTVWPDPTHEFNREAAHAARYGKPTPEQCMWLAEIASAYDCLLSHSWGTEVSVAKLRKLRKAVAKRFDSED